ncbi:hypothetical protein [Insulibacter thermoxylanivorax]|uniref:hypothetical protein n=1 Tax=Insulibacter thermoxylanivorax TaxID=2749268 RepID=UPI00190FC06D|nr:hypothetical protein [Insulibacter thermoxylanivorax]
MNKLYSFSVIYIIFRQKCNGFIQNLCAETIVLVVSLIVAASAYAESLGFVVSAAFPPTQSLSQQFLLSYMPIPLHHTLSQHFLLSHPPFRLRAH